MKASQAIRELLEITAQLREQYGGGRRFPLDGMLVGDLGEVIAAERYGLELERQSRLWDARTTDGRTVEVKASCKSREKLSYAFQAGHKVEHRVPDFVICLWFARDGTIETIYNGPGAIVWTNLGTMGTRNSQRVISAKRLVKLMEGVNVGMQLPQLKDCDAW